MYITPRELREIILEAQENNQLTERLALLVDKMVRALNSRYHFVSRSEEDDAAQDGILLIAKKIHNCDVDRHPFNWVTTVLANMLKVQARAQKNHYFTCKRFAEHLRNSETDDSGGEIWRL